MLRGQDVVTFGLLCPWSWASGCYWSPGHDGLPTLCAKSDGYMWSNWECEDYKCEKFELWVPHPLDLGMGDLKTFPMPRCNKCAKFGCCQIVKMKTYILNLPFPRDTRVQKLLSFSVTLSTSMPVFTKKMNGTYWVILQTDRPKV